MTNIPYRPLLNLMHYQNDVEPAVYGSSETTDTLCGKRRKTSRCVLREFVSSQDNMDRNKGGGWDGIRSQKAADLLEVVNSYRLVVTCRFHQVATSLLPSLLQLVETTCCKPVDNKF